jgi:hypothetical protein
MPKVKVLTVIHADGRPDTVTQEKDTLETLQKAVGGYIEAVPYFRKYNGRVATVYCHDEGKILNFPINRKATAAWRAAYPDTTDYLVGDILVVQTVPKTKE